MNASFKSQWTTVSVMFSKLTKTTVLWRYLNSSFLIHLLTNSSPLHILWFIMMSLKGRAIKIDKAFIFPFIHKYLCIQTCTVTYFPIVLFFMWNDLSILSDDSSWHNHSRLPYADEERRNPLWEAKFVWSSEKFFHSNVIVHKQTNDPQPFPAHSFQKRLKREGIKRRVGAKPGKPKRKK